MTVEIDDVSQWSPCCSSPDMLQEFSIKIQHRLMKAGKNMQYELKKQRTGLRTKISNVKDVLLHEHATDNKNQPLLTNIEDFLVKICMASKWHSKEGLSILYFSFK